MWQEKEVFNEIMQKKPERILLKVRAGAKRNAIEGFIEIENKRYLKLSIKTMPEKGKANKMIIEFLAKSWGVMHSNLEIVTGKTSQYKVLKVKYDD